MEMDKKCLSAFENLLSFSSQDLKFRFLAVCTRFYLNSATFTNKTEQ